MGSSVPLEVVSAGGLPLGLGASSTNCCGRHTTWLFPRVGFHGTWVGPVQFHLHHHTWKSTVTATVPPPPAAIYHLPLNVPDHPTYLSLQKHKHLANSEGRTPLPDIYLYDPISAFQPGAGHTCANHSSELLAHHIICQYAIRSRPALFLGAATPPSRGHIGLAQRSRPAASLAHPFTRLAYCASDRLSPTEY